MQQFFLAPPQQDHRRAADDQEFDQRLEQLHQRLPGEQPGNALHRVEPVPFETEAESPAAQRQRSEQGDHQHQPHERGQQQHQINERLPEHDLHLTGVHDVFWIQRHPGPHLRGESFEQRRSENQQSGGGDQQHRQRGQFARTNDLPFVGGILLSSGRGLFGFFLAVFIFSHQPVPPSSWPML